MFFSGKPVRIGVFFLLFSAVFSCVDSVKKSRMVLIFEEECTKILFKWRIVEKSGGKWGITALRVTVWQEPETVSVLQ